MRIKFRYLKMAGRFITRESDFSGKIEDQIF
jgi:hypothetical protein